MVSFSFLESENAICLFEVLENDKFEFLFLLKHDYKCSAQVLDCRKYFCETDSHRFSAEVQMLLMIFWPYIVFFSYS